MLQRVDHLRLLARYNAWMNERLYATAMKLPDEELAEDRGAFFGSILATLNHIMVADTIWLKRFATHPDGLPALEPMLSCRIPGLDEGWPYADIRSLRQRRQELDAMIPTWTENLREENLDLPLTLRCAAAKPIPTPSSRWWRTASTIRCIIAGRSRPCCRRRGWTWVTQT